MSSMNANIRYSIAIPTLNAEHWLATLLPVLMSPDTGAEKILILDSSSDDRTRQICKDAGCEIVDVERAEFDHGGTRQLAVEHCQDEQVIVFLTQDALPVAPSSIRALVDAFVDPVVAVAYGRQLPRPGALSIEAFSRLYNYPTAPRVDDSVSLTKDGVQAAFCSNSFSAYRISALKQTGGFPINCIFGEDMLASISLMRAGWKKYYVPTATVFHSHKYSLLQDLRRSFDIGVMHSISPEILAFRSLPQSRGLDYANNEQLYLFRHSPLDMLPALVRTFAKAIGYTAGTQHVRLPRSLIKAMTMNRRYWLQTR